MKVLVVGEHPILPGVVSWLSQNDHTVYFVAESKVPCDLVIFGNEYRPGDSYGACRGEGTLNSLFKLNTETPILCLSGADMYSDRGGTSSLKKTYMSELWRPSMETGDLVIPQMLLYESWLLGCFRNATIFRTLNPYGPNCLWGKVYAMLAQAKSGSPVQIPHPGSQTTTFLFEEDLLAAIARYIESDRKMRRGVFNIASAEEVTYMTVAQILWKEFWGDAPLKIETEPTDGTWWQLLSTKKANAVFLWQAKKSLRNGLKITAQAVL